MLLISEHGSSGNYSFDAEVSRLGNEKGLETKILNDYRIRKIRISFIAIHINFLMYCKKEYY